MKSSTKNMTVGSPIKLIVGFAVPMLLGMLFQQFYNMVDTMVIGKWLGIDALAGVGSTSSLNFMIVGFCTGLGTGFAIPIAQSFGAKDYCSLRRFVANAVWLSLALLSVLTVLVCVFCRDILVLMKTPEEIIGYAYNYIFVIFAGLPVMYAYNLLAAIMRALGDSKSPVIFLVISAFLNIVLDIISVRALGMGVEGPALATIISQSISVLLCFFYIIKKFDILRIQKDEWCFDIKKIAKLFSIGMPMGLQYSITAIGSVILQSSVNDLGTSIVASVTAMQKINMFFACPFEALGGTMATYSGQNTGVGDAKRINKGLGYALLLGVAYGFTAFGVLFFFGKEISMLFLEANETEIINNTYKYLLIQSFSYFLLSFVNNVRFTIQGMGYSMFAIIAGVMEMIARALTGIFLVPAFGYIAVCCSSALAWLLADAFLIPAYFFCIKRLKKRFS